MYVPLLLYLRQGLPGTIEGKLYLTHVSAPTDRLELISKSQPLLDLFVLHLSNLALIYNQNLLHHLRGPTEER